MIALRLLDAGDLAGVLPLRRFQGRRAIRQFAGGALQNPDLAALQPLRRLQRGGALSQTRRNGIDLFDRRLQATLTYGQPAHAAGAGRGHPFQVGDGAVLVCGRGAQFTHAQGVVRRGFLQRRDLADALGRLRFQRGRTPGKIRGRGVQRLDFAGAVRRRGLHRDQALPLLKGGPFQAGDFAALLSLRARQAGQLRGLTGLHDLGRGNARPQVSDHGSQAGVIADLLPGRFVGRRHPNVRQIGAVQTPFP
ncbi:hypothetical protein D3C71_1347840 [compost metagenome]